MPFHKTPNEIVIHGDVAIMTLTRKDHSSLETIFDAEHVARVLAHPYRWGVHYEKRIDGYYVLAVNWVEGKRRGIGLHRLVTNCPDGFVPDHINHDTLDNRGINLRIVPQAVNLRNKKGAYKRSKSGVRGVHFHKITGKWCAQVDVGGKHVFYKLFDRFEDACEAVKVARKEIYGEVV